MEFKFQYFIAELKEMLRGAIEAQLANFNNEHTDVRMDGGTKLSVKVASRLKWVLCNVINSVSFFIKHLMLDYDEQGLLVSDQLRGLRARAREHQPSPHSPGHL